MIKIKIGINYRFYLVKILLDSICVKEHKNTVEEKASCVCLQKDKSIGRNGDTFRVFSVTIPQPQQSSPHHKKFWKNWVKVKVWGACERRIELKQAKKEFKTIIKSKAVSTLEISKTLIG